MKTQVKYQYSPSGNGELLLTIDGKVIGKVYSKEYAEMIERRFNIDVDGLNNNIKELESRIDELQRDARKI